jgi:ADP-ribose pyrophosphatase YjhB (NUDIX family)
LRENALIGKTVDVSTDRNRQPYRDSQGKRLEDYPRPSVAVDTALLTLTSGDDGKPVLSVLQVRRQNDRGWGLPGTFLHPGERLIDAVLRSLRAKAGVAGLQPRQLYVFDEPDRDDRGWVLSVAHVDVVPIRRLDGRDPEQTRIVPAERPGRLPYGHGEIIHRAVADLRRRYEAEPDPDRLLPEQFTLRELRHVHQAVLGRTVQRDTFRRAMEHALVPTGTATTRGPGRPAELFRRAQPTHPEDL